MANKPNIITRAFRTIVRNTIDVRNWDGNVFLRRGNRDVVNTQDLSLIDIQPKEYYSGQLYAAIRTRANRVASLAKENVKTRIFDDPEKELERTDQHPYLTLVNQSPTFSNTFFWRAMSTFLDLTGTAYIFVLRNYSEKVVGTAQEFSIINPYNLTKVVNATTGDYRYIETRAGAWREIPSQQMIAINSFNPFNLKDGFAMVEAAKDDHYQIKQARDYARKAIKNNIGQRGLLTTDIIMEDEKFTNFVEKIKSKETGEFIFGNGPDALRYTDMQIDLEKLALGAINKISTETLIAVSGASKTILGIEQSEVSQEAAKTQKDLFTENHGIPQTDDIIDALNQDYKNRYTAEYESNKLEIYVDSPLKVDKESELKDADIEKRKAETAVALIDGGFTPKSVMSYLELDDDLEFEERQPRPGTQPGQPAAPEQPEDTEETQSLTVVTNTFSPGLEPVVKGYESTLANQIANIEGQVLNAMLPKLDKKFAKNELTEGEKTLSEKDRKRLERDIELALAAFGIAVISLFGGQSARKRFAEFALPAEFTMSAEVTKAINSSAALSARSHLQTFTKAVFDEAKKAGIEGLSREAIVSRLTSSFPDLSRVNATRIARTESYKAVNMAQFEADKQFITQNGLEGRVYKQWVTQSSNPCPYCTEMASRPAVPFNQEFLSLGDSVKAEFKQESGTVTKELVNNFEPIDSGTLHPNCSCTYDLTIK